MSSNSLDAMFYVREVPGITFEDDGLVHLVYQVGKRANFEVVLSPSVFLKALRVANRVADEFHDRATVAPIKKGRGGH
jgi:hypothetical protein